MVTHLPRRQVLWVHRIVIAVPSDFSELLVLGRRAFRMSRLVLFRSLLLLTEVGTMTIHVRPCLVELALPGDVT